MKREKKNQVLVVQLSGSPPTKEYERLCRAAAENLAAQPPLWGAPFWRFQVFPNYLYFK